MQRKTEFSEYGEKHKLRVMDVTSKPPLYFDKKLSTILLCMEYLDALEKNTVDQRLQIKMHGLLDEVLRGFTPTVDNNSPEYKRIVDNINEIKKQDVGYNLLEAYELICLQLTVLRKLSNKSFAKDKIVDVKSVFDTSIDNVGACQSVRKLVIYPKEKTEESLLKNVIPVYSSNATVGFNTILFSIFNNLSPVGVGENPHQVHDKWLENRPISLLTHDYGHGELTRRSQVEDPETFTKYKKIYFELFENKKHNRIE